MVASHRRHDDQPSRQSDETLVTASALKLRLAEVVTSDLAGRVISALTRGRVRHQGLWFDVSGGDFSPRILASMFWGGYEGAETRMIRAFLRDSKTVVELGSSLGVTTAHVASLMRPGGHLICVEANPALLPGLRRRLLPHATGLRVDFVQAAVTHRCGTAELCLGQYTFGSRLNGTAATSEPTLQVPAITLREILSQHAVAEFDLVSDIEGAEVSFLLDDPSALHSCRRAVMELHATSAADGDVSVFDLIDAAAAAGLHVIDRHGPVVALARD